MTIPQTTLDRSTVRPGGHETRWLSRGLLAIAVIVAAYSRLLHITNPTIVALSFLLVVFAVAARSTLRAAIVTSLAATACFNYFFLPPTGTWAIADLENWFALFTLLVASVLVSRLSAQVRSRAQEAVARRDELARLFDLTRDILLTESADPIATIAGHIVRRFRFSRAAIFRRTDGAWTEHTAGDPLRVETSALERVFGATLAKLEFDAHARTYTGTEQVRTVGRLPVWLVPLRLGTAAVGVLALEHESIDAGTRDAIAGNVAIAIERQQLLDERREAEVARRSAELRSTLLASLSHDLRTPLTAVSVASNNLGVMTLSDAERRDQIDVIRTEIARLNRLFDNIMEMARIETRAITPEAEWVQPAEIIDAARQQAGFALATRRVIVDVDERMAVHVDPRRTSVARAAVARNAG